MYGMKTRTPQDVITQRGNQTPPAQPRKRRVPLWVWLCCDVVVAGMLLCVFALYHHVLPQTYATLEEPPIVNTEPTPPDTSMGAKFADKFTATPVRTDTSYSSPNVAFTVEKCTQTIEDEPVTYYVANIYVRHVECLRTAFAGNTYGKGISEPLLTMADNHHALLAVTGDYYGRHYGPVIRNGVLYRDSIGSGDVCVLYKDGTMKTFAKGTFKAATEMQNGAWQAWCFGPSLLTADGNAISSFNHSLSSKHPRCAIGYYEPGHYALVVVDGRADGYSVGMTLPELSSLFTSLGCTAAYNLDGGRTAQMAYNGALVNQPYKGGRDISDIIFLGEVPTE